MSILKNEKFKGDALLQKHYTQDFLTKKQVKNKGEVEQFYVLDDHEAIIDKKTFDMVQLEIKNRDLRYSSDIIGSKLVCAKCGNKFGRKILHSNDKYKKVIYRCNHKYENNNGCDTGYVTENENDYTQEHNKLVIEYEKLQKKIDILKEKIESKMYKEKVINLYIEKLNTTSKKITEFDKSLFAMLVDRIIIDKAKKELKWKIAPN